MPLVPPPPPLCRETSERPPPPGQETLPSSLASLVPLSLPLGGVKGSLVEASSAAETGEMGWVTGLGTGLVWPAPLRRACQACQGKAGLDWVALACLVGPFEVLGLCSNQSYQYS